MKVLLLILCFALTANAQWPRVVITPKGGQVDAPPSQPLKYFTELPWLRDEGGEFCYLCTPEERLAQAKAAVARADVQFVAKIGRFNVYDIFYYFADDPTPGWKSIVVQTGADRYQEIYHDQPNEGIPIHSFVVRAGKEPLLCVVDNVFRWDEQEDCFWFSATGAVRVDFSPIWNAAQQTVQGRHAVWDHHLGARANFANLTIPVGIRSDWNNRCCVDGVVYVRFTMDHGRVIVLKTTFNPDAVFVW